MCKIRVIIKTPGCQPTLGWIDNTLEAFQELVGGYIETTPLDGVPGVLLIVNEEGKLNGLPENVINGADVIVGSIVAVRAGSEDFVSLTEDDIPIVIDTLNAGDVGRYGDDSTLAYSSSAVVVGATPETAAADNGGI